MQAVLFDLDGVIYQGEEAIEGAADTVRWVQRHDIPYLFVSNTSGHPRRSLVEKLAGMDIRVDAEHILIPPVAAARWLKKNASGPVALFVAEETREEFSGLEILDKADDERPAAVVVGHLGREWTYDRLNRAFGLLMNDAKPQLIALGKTRYAREVDGLCLDVGPFVAALEYACGRNAIVLGKPDRAFFGTALEILGSDAGQTVMIGDDIAGDVEAAQKSGMKGLQVRTGKFRDEDLERGIMPDGVLDSVAELPKWWRENSAP